jgi:transcriptional regulator with XRE-family HTH domain
VRIHTPGEIGLLVKDARQARRWSQERLAEAIGATRQWVHMLESGKPRLELGLTLRALTALELALDVTLARDVTDPSVRHESSTGRTPAALPERSAGSSLPAQASGPRDRRSRQGRPR